MIQQVVGNEVMLAAAAFSISQERMEAVNFTSAFDLHPYAFMYRRPKTASKAFLFLDPFSPEVWIGIALMTVIIGPIFYIIHRSSLYYKYKDQRLVGIFGNMDTLIKWLLKTNLKFIFLKKSEGTVLVHTPVS